MANFTYSDVVRVVADADERFRPNARAWVIGVFPKRPSGSHFDSFPEGAVYAIEFDDGEAIDIPESLLEPYRVVLEPASGSGHRVSTIRLALALAAALVSSLFAGALVVAILSPVPFAKAVAFYVDRWALWLLLYVVWLVLLLLKRKVDP
jgi:hypothetical protein